MKINIDKTYGPYSETWIPAPRYLLRRARVLKLLEHCVPGRLLEIGCGAGALISELHSLGYDCMALEESEQAILMAKEFNKKNSNQIVNQLSNGIKNNFHYLIAFEVLEHIKNDLDALKDWRSYMLPSGMLFLSVPAHLNKWNATDEWAGHVRRYERKQLQDLFNQAGFDILHFETYGYPLANIIEPIRALLHSKELKKRTQQKQNIVSLNNDQSGIARNIESKLFFLLKNPLGKIIMLFFIRFQTLFLNTDLGNGYIVIARPKQDAL